MCDINKLCDFTSETKSRETIKWHAATDLDKQEYNIETEKLASTITLPIDAFLCKNTSCTKHCEDIDSFYTAINNALKLSANIVYRHLLLLLNVILYQAGMSMLKNITYMLKMPSGGGIYITGHVTVQYTTT